MARKIIYKALNWMIVLFYIIGERVSSTVCSTLKSNQRKAMPQSQCLEKCLRHMHAETSFATSKAQVAQISNVTI